MSQSSPTISLVHAGGYQFTIDFGELIPQLAVDEPVPIGGGQGPSPEQLLMSGVANCLCASLVFALTKHRTSIDGMKAVATCNVTRNEDGRLRVGGIEVTISLIGVPGNASGTERALAEFENFCTVSESVKKGIPVQVKVYDEYGALLKAGNSGDSRG